MHIKPADKRDSEKWSTPLCVAVGFNLPHAVSLLLEKRADPYARNSIGRTPIDIAKRKRPEVQEIIQNWEKE